MREWYFQVMGQELGPLSAAELKAKVEAGQIQPDTMIRRGVDGKWLFAERVKGLLPERRPDPVLIPLPTKAKSSATLPVYDGSPTQTSTTHNPPAQQPRSSPVIMIPLNSDDEEDDSTKPPSVEFYDFVGFREAISPVLHHAARQYLGAHSLTMTQLNRRALAAFVGRPELASELMITNMSVILQPVNEKSNADGRDALTERDRMEHATLRLTLFNCSSTALDVSGGLFLPEMIETRDYEEVGTKLHPPLDHKGHVSVSVDGIVEGTAIPIALKKTVEPRAAITIVLWFRSSKKPSFMRIRGHLRLAADGGDAYSEAFTVIMHGDSPY